MFLRLVEGRSSPRAIEPSTKPLACCSATNRQDIEPSGPGVHDTAAATGTEQSLQMWRRCSLAGNEYTVQPHYAPQPDMVIAIDASSLLQPATAEKSSGSFLPD